MLAELTGLSASALSQIELGLTDPSIGSLRRIASALQVPFFQFLVQRDSPDPVVRKNERRTITFPNRVLQYQLLTPNLGGPFEILAMDLAPGAASGEEALGHASEESMVIVEGDVEVLAGYGQDRQHGLILHRPSEEHAVVEGVLKRANQGVAIGDRLRFVPNHACTVANLASVLVGVRCERVCQVMPVRVTGGGR